MIRSSSRSSLDAFHEFAGREEQFLEGVFERVEHGCRDQIVLRFSSGDLCFLADADTDTIEVRFQEPDNLDLSGLRSVAKTHPWRSKINRRFGWGWVAVNQQGYQDGILLSFEGIQPSVMLNVEASSIRVYYIHQATGLRRKRPSQ